MRHKFLVLTVKKWLKSVYIYGSYRKIKTGVPLFLDHSVDVYKSEKEKLLQAEVRLIVETQAVYYTGCGKKSNPLSYFANFEATA